MIKLLLCFVFACFGAAACVCVCGVLYGFDRAPLAPGSGIKYQFLIALFGGFTFTFGLCFRLISP